MMINVTLWNGLDVDKSVNGKTVVLKNFRINEFMDLITLNSRPQSKIQPL
jgi:hypothetical protein